MSIEQLKAAYEAAPKGSWIYDPTRFDAVVRVSNNKVLAVADFGKLENSHGTGEFVALAHKMMPAIIEAVEAADRLQEALGADFDDCHLGELRKALAVLKGNHNATQARACKNECSSCGGCQQTESPNGEF